MKTGHHIATKTIPLCRPFEAAEIPLGDRFDVLAVCGGYALIRYEGIRCWKSLSGFERFCAQLSPMVLADDGFRLVRPESIAGTSSFPLVRTFDTLAPEARSLPESVLDMLEFVDAAMSPERAHA
ncbi:MAG: hypothetical protein WC100_20950 [Sterolibacterium sp.]